jgi:hypothetical protein
MHDVHSRVEVDPVRYKDYLGLLVEVLESLSRYYGDSEREGRTREEESMALYANKFFETVKALRLKFLHSPVYLSRPGVDLTDSGFPNFYDIMQLDADLSTRGERLPKLPPIDVLKELLLEHVMIVPSLEQEDDHVAKMHHYLWQISERAYLESLDLRVQFFQFTPGKLEQVPQDEFREEGRRSYTFSWGCYDPQTNRPSVYFMLFTQDETERPLDEVNNPEYAKFLDTVRHVAARAPKQLKVIGLGLDELFKNLYPKAIKRFNIGPLVSPMLYKGLGEGIGHDTFALWLLPLFERSELNDDDFVLLFNTEFVYSEREEVPEKFLPFGKQKVRQMFYVPKNDRELLRRGAGAFLPYALMPHRLRQHITPAMLETIPEFNNGTSLLVYGENNGEVINVG